MKTDKKKHNLKTLSLFSGAMGLDLGLESLGFEILACVENNKDCVATIRKNRPELMVYAEDINEVETSRIMSELGIKKGELDLIVGGPPCQAFSTAGKRRSFEDFRGNVIVRFLDYVKDFSPKYFILENVRGIYSAKLANTPPEYAMYKEIENVKGSVVYFLYSEFRKLGYSISFNLFDSSFYGVPQKRERFVMFGVFNKAPVPIPKPLTESNPPTLKNAIFDIQENVHEYVEVRKGHRKYVSLLREGQNWTDLPTDIKKEAMGKSYYLTGGRTGFFRRLAWNVPSPTLVTSPVMPATMLIHPKEDRPLSIQEYAQIQQFPKKWHFEGALLSKYKQIGNAVPFGLGKMAGKAVMEHFSGKGTESYSGKTSRYNNTSSDSFISDFVGKHLSPRLL